MGNLICCYEKDDQKRGGVNLKTLLRQTEKPGKRRKRIDELVADVLKREKRDERQKKKREKKEFVSDKDLEGHVHLADSKTNDSTIQGQAFDGDENKENNFEKVGQGVYTNDSSTICQAVSEANTPVKYQTISSVTETSQKTDSVFENNEDQKNIYNGSQEYYKGVLEDQLSITNGTGCTEDVDLPNHDNCESPLITDQNTAVDILEKGTDCDSNEVNAGSKGDELSTVLKDIETSNVIGDGVKRENTQVDKITKPLKTDKNSENICKENEDYLNTGRPIGGENDINEDWADSAEDSKRDHGNELSEETKIELGDCGTAGELPLVFSIDHDEEKLSDICENNIGDLRTENMLAEDNLQNEILNLIDNSSDIPEEDINDQIADSTRDHSEDKPGYDNIKNTKDDDKTVNNLKVHGDTDISPRGYENTETVDDCNKVNILKVLDTDSFIGYDNTKLIHEEDDDDDDEYIRNNMVLKPIQRSKSMPFKRWGSANDLRATKRTSADSSKDINSFKNQLNRLKQIYAHSKTIGIPMKNHLQRTSNNGPKVKYAIKNIAGNGGQKPQIKEIIRLKKDPFNFPPKMRQFTERDRQGSIADLRWSRHMRSEVRRHISMETTEFEEIMFLNGGENIDDSEFDVCDEPRAHTPIPGYDEPRSPRPVTGYDEPRSPTPVPGYDAQCSPTPVPGYDEPRAPTPVPGYDEPRSPRPVPGYDEPRAPTPVLGHDEPRSSRSVPGYDEPRAPTPVPGYDGPRAPTPVPGCDVLHANSPAPDFSRDPSPHRRCDPRRTKTSKMDETIKNVRDRCGSERVRYTRHSIPNTSTLTTCSRNSKPNNTFYRLYTQAGDRKKNAAFQTIVRQFEKSFKDAEARRSKDTKRQSSNQTSCVGIGRQSSLMNLGNDTTRRDN